MSLPNVTAQWILNHQGLALGRLLTISRYLTIANAEVNRLLGYLDGNNPGVRRVELGIAEMESRILTAVRALDMVEPAD